MAKRAKAASGSKPPAKAAMSAAEFERAIAQAASEKYVLRLYVTGLTPRSQKAIENIRKLCAEHLEGNYELQIIDLYQQPVAAKDEQILAAPTLVKKLPLPLRRVLGDLSSPGKVLVALGLKVKDN